MYNCSVRLRFVQLLLFLSLTAPLFAQQKPFTQIAKFDLPVSHSRGLWWDATLRSKWIFNAKLGPHNDLFVFDVDKSGRWPLVRIRDWWTKESKPEVLDVPGFGKEAASHLFELRTRIYFSDDDRYAIGLAEASWSPTQEQRAAHQFRDDEAVLNVIDLKSWKITASVPTKSLGYSAVDGLKVLPNGLVAIETYHHVESGNLIQFALLSFPSLSPIASCKTEWKEKDFDLKDGCSKLLNLSGFPSLLKMNEQLTGFTRTGSPVNGFAELMKSEVTAEDGSRFVIDGVNSQLSRSNTDGTDVSKKDIPELCAGQKVIGPAFSCDCRLLSASTDADRVLARCSSAHDNLLGWQVPLKDWLVIFRASDLSSLGNQEISKYSMEHEVLSADIAGKLYLAEITTGDSITIYSVN